MTIRLSLLALSLVLWSSPGIAGRKALHTRFFFALVGGKEGHWTETAPTPSPLGSVGGWTCTAGPIELSELSSGHIVKTADIECLDTNGSLARVMATCDVADEARDNQDIMLRMKNAQDVHVSLSCYTRRE
jgi:hypothetical protein